MVERRYPYTPLGIGDRALLLFPGGPDDGKRSPRHSGLAWIWHSGRARRSGMLYAQAAEVRQLAACLADVEPLD